MHLTALPVSSVSNDVESRPPRAVLQENLREIVLETWSTRRTLRRT